MSHDSVAHIVYNIGGWGWGVGGTQVWTRGVFFSPLSNIIRVGGIVIYVDINSLWIIVQHGAVTSQ